jgi:hypothetical protein
VQSTRTSLACTAILQYWQYLTRISVQSTSLAGPGPLFHGINILLFVNRERQPSGAHLTPCVLFVVRRCKGEVAMRHRNCAEKWSRIKGSTTCDVCKAPILNLPDVPPLPPPPGHAAGEGGLLGPPEHASLWSIDEPPAVADYIFDFIRVTWVVLVVCIFLEVDVARSFVTGALLGTVYVALAASWAAARRRGRRQRMVNAAAVWVAGQGQAAGGEQRVPLLQGLVGGLEGMPV